MTVALGLRKKCSFFIFSLVLQFNSASPGLAHRAGPLVETDR